MTCTALLTVVGIIVIFGFRHWKFQVQFENFLICSIVHRHHLSSKISRQTQLVNKAQKPKESQMNNTVFMEGPDVKVTFIEVTVSAVVACNILAKLCT